MKVLIARLLPLEKLFPWSWLLRLSHVVGGLICQSATKHFFDIWHVAKSVSKKLLQVGKESGCELLVKWQRAIKNHLHWCATSTKLGFGELILAKWKSIVRHVCNKHDNHPDPLFRQCVHGPTSRRYWLKKGELFWQIQLILNILFLDLNLGLTCNPNTPWEITLL